MKFRLKPVIIEAFQMTRERRWDNSEWPEWLNAAWQKDPSQGSLWCGESSQGEQLVVGTACGNIKIIFNDWIIQDNQGNLDVIDPDNFELMYERESSAS